MPSLAIRLDGKITGTARLEKDETVLGRRDDCDVVIPDVNASRTHARIIKDGQRYVVEDLGSHNGITVNGAQVERHVLADGDRIGIGSYFLDFLLGDIPPVDDVNDGASGEDVSGRGVRTFDEGEDGELGDMLRGMLNQARTSIGTDRTMAMGESPLRGMLKDNGSAAEKEGSRPSQPGATPAAGCDGRAASSGKKRSLALIVGGVLLILMILVLAIIVGGFL